MYAIECHELSKRFRKNAVLKSVTFAVNSGEIVLIAGENGAGKTTLIKTVLGLIKPSEGSVTFDSLPIEKVRDNISVVFDEPNLYPHLSGLSNIRYLAGVKYLDPILLSTLKDNLRLTDNFLTLRGKKYSFGQRRRIAVCAALIRKPDYLFLDEPMIGLDPLAWNMFKKIIAQIHNARGTTIVMTGQNFSGLEDLISRVIVLKNGTIIFDGTANELKSKCQPVLIIKTDSYTDVLDNYPQADVKTHKNSFFCEITCQDMSEAEELMRTVLSRKILIKGIEIKQPSLEEAFAIVSQDNLERA
jgi:ABC-type multidrug transport system ATPase subunit